MSTDEEKLSALQESISRKGNNSYYYAHGNKIDGPKWDGKEEPRLLSSTQIVAENKKLLASFDSFSWLDCSTSVKIFIEFNNAPEVLDEFISLVCYP